MDCFGEIPSQGLKIAQGEMSRRQQPRLASNTLQVKLGANRLFLGRQADLAHPGIGYPLEIVEGNLVHPGVASEAFRVALFLELGRIGKIDDAEWRKKHR